MSFKKVLLTTLILFPFAGCVEVEDDEFADSSEAQERLEEALDDAFYDYTLCKFEGEDCLSEEEEVIRYSEELETTSEGLETTSEDFRFGVVITPCNDGSYVVCDCTAYANFYTNPGVGCGCSVPGATATVCRP